MRKITKTALFILLDILLAAAILCVFSYYHHIQYLWAGVETPTNGDGIVFDNPFNNKEENTDNSDPNSPNKPDDTENDSENDDSDQNGDSDSDTDSDNDLPIDDGYDRSGDFGERFYNKFLKKGEQIISTDTMYKSNDISITLKEINTNLYYNNKTYFVQYFIYDIYIRNVENFYTGANTTRLPFNELIENTKIDKNLGIQRDFAIAAVNGDYWGNANHTHVAVRNGELLRHSEYITSDIMVMYYDGTMETIHPQDYNYKEVYGKYPYQIWEFGPSLLDENGKALETKDFDPSSYDSHVIGERNPRCGVGYFEPGHYCFVVVDGRSSDSQGMRMFQLADVFEKLGCKVAYNMDGGDSSQAYFNGNTIRVDEEREINGEEQRPLYDIICIGEVKKQ